MNKGCRKSMLIVSGKGVIASVILLAGLFGFFFFHKDNSQINNVKLIAEDAQKRAIVAEENAANARAEIFQLREHIAKLSTDLQKITKAHDVESNRLLLLASLFNENFAAIANCNPNDIIFIGRHWQIKRLPKYLDLTEADIEWFEQFLNKSAASPVLPK